MPSWNSNRIFDKPTNGWEISSSVFGTTRRTRLYTQNDFDFQGEYQCGLMKQKWKYLHLDVWIYIHILGISKSHRLYGTGLDNGHYESIRFDDVTESNENIQLWKKGGNCFGRKATAYRGNPTITPPGDDDDEDCPYHDENCKFNDIGHWNLGSNGEGAWPEYFFCGLR